MSIQLCLTSVSRRWRGREVINALWFCLSPAAAQGCPELVTVADSISSWSLLQVVERTEGRSLQAEWVGS